MSRRFAVCAVATAFTLAVGACSDPPNAPVSPAGAEVESSSVKFWEAGSSVGWNATARDLLVSRGFNPFAGLRILTYLSVAQYNAVIAAENAKEGGDHPSPAAAAAGASLVVLKSFFPAPADGAAFDAQLAAQLAAPGWPGEQNKDVELGEAIGRSIGADVVAYAATDGLNSVVPVPKGPGLYFWTSSLNPPVQAALGLYGTRTWALISRDQFRPVAPPPLESAEFQAALAEVRAISDTRTDEQLAIARKWAAQGPPYWNSVAAAMIVAHRQSERVAAHTLALANMAGFDATNACFDAKFEYWTARPTKVDPGITLAVPLPNFPSYPSAHSCISGAFVAVLSSIFPAETNGLQAQLDEVGRARVYGGLHYQFDCDIGRVLGLQVAEWVMSQDVQSHAPIALD